MRVFVTGVSRHIASAVIPELFSAGHAVTGLARPDPHLSDRRCFPSPTCLTR
jgi:nucleoside-diphosphate-sugar epimerase